MEQLLFGIVFGLAIAAVLVWLSGPRRPELTRGVALVASVSSLGAAGRLWESFQPRGREWQFVDQAPPLPWIGSSLLFGVDGLSVLLVWLTALAAVLAIATSPAPAGRRANLYYVSVLTLEMGVFGVLTSLHFVGFVLFWLTSVLSAWNLLGVWSGASRAVFVRRFALSTAVASALVIAGLAILVVTAHSITGAYTFDLRTFQHLTLPSTLQYVVFVLFLVGFGVMCGVFPLHGAQWTVQVHASAATSIFVAAVLAKIGAYGLLRFNLPMLPDATRFFSPVLALISLAGILVAAVGVWKQKNWRQSIGYVTLAQASAIVLALSVLTPRALTASVLQQINLSLWLVAALVLVAAYDGRDQEARVPDGTPALEAMPNRAGRAVLLGIMTLGIVAPWFSVSPPFVLGHVETSVARIVLRVSPQHAAEVADCLTASQAPPPPPEIPGLPAGASMAAPCDTSEAQK